MNNRPFTHRHYSVSKLLPPALAVVCLLPPALAVVCLLAPASGFAQSNAPRTQEQAAETHILTTPDSQGAETSTTHGDQGLKGKRNAQRLPDYRRRTTHKASKPELPLFGYEFFRPAQEIIKAHRAYLRRLYGAGQGGQNSPSNSRALSRAKQSKRTKDGSPQNGGAFDENDGSNRSRDAEDAGELRSRSGDMGSAIQNDDTSANHRQADQNGDTGDDSAEPDFLHSHSDETGNSSGDSSQTDTSRQHGDGAGDTNDDTDSTSQTDTGHRSRSVDRRDDNAGTDSTSGNDDKSIDNNDNTVGTGSAHRHTGDTSDDTYTADATHKRYSRDDNSTSGGSQSRQTRGRPEANADGTSSEPASDLNPGPVDAYQQVTDPLTQLYRNVNATVPANYQLAADDTLTIRYWSPRHEMQTLTRKVNAQGSVIIPGVGPVVVRALTLDQAEKVLRVQLRRYYNGVDVAITLDKLRTIQIMVSGMAFQPGTYTVPAVATAFNVLYAAGGPTEEGSLRNVEVRRNGKLVGTLDVYNYLMVGGQAGDIALQSGDLIYIPPRQSRVEVSGEVLQPAIYELRRSETLRDALRYAGGVKPSGVDQHIQINTIVPGTTRVLKDINLQDQAKANSVPLFDGDAVEIFSVRPLIANQVTVEGAVDQPNDYALEPGMRVADLLTRARGLLPDAYPARADLMRTNPDNTTTLISINLEQALAHAADADIALQPWDRLKVYTREEVSWTGRRSVTVQGAVQRVGIYDYSDHMHVSDLLLMAGGPKPDAFTERAVLLHRHGDGTFAIDYVNLSSVLHSDKAQDVELQDNDILTVYRIGEAQFEAEHVVTIRGEVVMPGAYPRTQNMRLSDLLKLAGGFRPDSSSRVVIAHARQIVDGKNGGLQTVSVLFDSQHRCAPQDDAQLEDGDVVTVQGSGDYQDHVQVINVFGSVKHPGPIILSSRQMRLSDAIREAGGLLPQAFPQGAEFTRDPKMMMSTGQRSIAETIGKLNDLLNDRAYSRERSKAYIERIKEVNAAERGNDTPLPTSNGSSGASSQATGAIAAQLAQQDTVSPPRRLTTELNPDGNIAVNLPAALAKPQGPDDPLLVEGDTIIVPEKPTTVQVVGAVIHGRGVLFRPGENIDYYVTQTGGFAPDAAQDRIEVIHVGGGMIPANKVHTLEPGDVILVPNRVLAEKLSSHANTFDSFFRSLTSSAIIFKVASSLFGL